MPAPARRRRARLRAFGLGLWLLSAACATPQVAQPLPDRDEWPADLVAACSDETGAALRRVAATAAQARFACRVNALERQLSGRPLVGGNRVELLVDGPSTHAAQLEAISQARHHVHLSVYILTDDAVGQRYLAAFRERTRAGVKVRVLFDAMGGRPAGDAFRQAMVDAGVELHEFGPMNPLTKPDEFQLSRRHHRKILVVDGRIAFTGGVNISDEYRTSSGGSRTTPGWRDTHVRVEGPVVAEFQRMFFDVWEAEHDRIAPDEAYWPRLAPAGDDYVRAVLKNGEDLSEAALAPLRTLGGRRGKHDEKNPIYGSYLAAINEAQSRIWLTQSYFVPNDEFLNALKRAAGRGVDVRLLVPGYTDIELMLAASRYHYEQLLEAGAHIYEYNNGPGGGSVLHAKTAVIDRVWSTVGSSNLDFRSFIHNDEANAIIIGHRFALQMERMFEKDLQTAREITREAWRERGWRQRLRENWAILFKYWI